ncbi:MAG: cation-transporting P-type ATPase, partial [Candidatus Moranbacteria bacterium]|nr:cation-transporting P-type ATPase [Candidatus Moranbacteria bacterium]
MVWKKFAAEEEGNVLAELGSSRDGLTSPEAKKRSFENRENRIKPGSSALMRVLKERLKSSFLYLLLAAAALSFFLGDILEGSLIGIFIFINLSLETYQEYHSANALRLLKRYLVVHARVRRGGKVIKIESTAVVPGDVVLVEAGDRLPADVRFLRVNGLELDESLLTGESVPVEKTAGLLKVPAVEMHEAYNIGFAGTVATSGWGEGVVFATGKETAFGDIASLTEETERETVFEKG